MPHYHMKNITENITFPALPFNMFCKTLPITINDYILYIHKIVTSDNALLLKYFLELFNTEVHKHMSHVICMYGPLKGQILADSVVKYHKVKTISIFRCSLADVHTCCCTSSFSHQPLIKYIRINKPGCKPITSNTHLSSVRTMSTKIWCTP